MQAFCESVETAAAVRSAGEDRRLGKAHLTVKMGGVAAAIEAYGTVPTPNVIILETEGGSDILAGLDELAGVCDPGTRVVVIGTPHDTAPYRELVRRGVSDYVIGPVTALDVVRSICSLFSARKRSRPAASSPSSAPRAASAPPPSRTMWHGRSRAISRSIPSSSTSTSPSAPPASTTIRIRCRASPMRCSPADRPDTALMERLLAKCTDRLSLLAAPATLERVYDFGEQAFDAIFDTLRMTTPCIVLDIPHQWSAWTKRALVGADDILIVAEPDLANLRNAKNMLTILKAARPNDRPPLYCLNQVGLPKRPEINAREFAKAIESPPIAAIPFDSRMFGAAANNGQMIAEISARHRTTEIFLQIAQRLTGHAETKPRGSFLSPIIRKLRAK